MNENTAPRPEPVVAPLPSEAVLRILDETREKFETASGESFWNRGAAHGLRVARAEIERLVPEDGEDTVRVPEHEHEWLDATNEVVSHTEVCLGCGSIRGTR